MVARVLQGFAAAVMIPQVLAVINTAPPGERCGWVMGWYGAASGIGSIAGQILGGWFIDADLAGLGWRAIFPVNNPVAALMLIAALLLLPRTRGTGAPRLDAPVAAGLGLGLAFVLSSFVLGREQAWPWWLWALALAGAGVLWGVLSAGNRLLRPRWQHRRPARDGLDSRGRSSAARRGRTDRRETKTCACFRGGRARW